MTHIPTRTFTGSTDNVEAEGTATIDQINNDQDEQNKMFDPTAIHLNGDPGGIQKGNLCRDSETGVNTSGIITDEEFTPASFDPVDGHKHDGTSKSGGPIDSKNVINTPSDTVTATNTQDAINQVNKSLNGFINQYAGQIVVPENNYIIKGIDGNYGGKFSPGNGLSVNISTVESMIGRKYQSNPAVVDFVLNARKASIIYQTKSESSLVAAHGRYDATFHEADSRTVSRWILNTTGAINDTVPTSNNYLNPSGTVVMVDGWADYGMQGDGVSGYYVSANSTGFPTGATPRTMHVLVTPYNVSSINYLAVYGTTAGWFGCYIGANGDLYFSASSSTGYDTEFALEIGKTYLVSLCYDGATASIFVNGTLIYTQAIVLNTIAGSLYVLRNTTTYYSNSIVHYIEIRNDAQSNPAIGAISNKLCLPCHYIGHNASYPTNDTTSGAHIYKFDDVSGNTVTDENGTLNGTATGTTIVDSDIGLNKARKFNGTSSDYVTCGNVALSGDMTVIFVGKFNSAASLGRIIGNTNNIIMALSEPATGVMGFYNSTTGWVNSKSPIQLDKNVFCAMSIKSGMLSFYIDSPFIDCTKPISWNTTSSPLTIGRSLNAATNTFNGFMDYLAIIPQALSQAEIAQYYNAFMVQKERTLIDDCLPSNSISLGFVRTDSTQVIEYNDKDYLYTRNEGATKSEGNTHVQSDWTYVYTIANVSNNIFYIKNPLGTTNIKVSNIKFKKNLYDSSYSLIDAMASNIGVFVSEVTNNYIKFNTAIGSNPYLIYTYNSYTGVFETSGYISVDIELL